MEMMKSLRERTHDLQIVLLWIIIILSPVPKELWRIVAGLVVLAIYGILRYSTPVKHGCKYLKKRYFSKENLL